MKNKQNRTALSVVLSCLAALAAAGTVPAALAQVTGTVLRNFAPLSPNGATPYSGVTLDPAGNLYGTGNSGGPANQGVVYKVNTAGKETVLYSFTGGADGGKPQGGVVLDSGGNLYGTASEGGAANAGVVYKIDGVGKQTVVYSFSGKLDGRTPYAGLIRDASGNLYGTTYNGGIYESGVLFMVDSAGHETVVYNFMGGSEGSFPTGAIVRDASGNFYGTTAYGGTTLSRCSHPPAGCGVVYKVTPSGQETVLHTFTADSDGSEPFGGVILDAEGNLYGTTYLGGAGTCTYGCGTIFKVSPKGKETILYDFRGGETDGYNPEAGVISDSAGNLYGTTYYGGSGGGGVVYELAVTGQETVLYNFKDDLQGPDGYHPFAGLTFDASGNLYGTTQSGGPSQLGALFKLNTAGQETILACFEGGAKGTNPQGGVTPDGAGNLYGTAYYGGPENAGLVYKVDAAGRETVLYSFRGGADGSNPEGSLVRDSAGNLYGMTLYGGASGGVVFKIDPAGGETVLQEFPVGVYPRPNLARDAAGNLYGTTFEGGLTTCDGFPGCGTVYKVDAAGTPTTLYEFTGGGDGANPNGGLVLDAEGNLYGTTAYGGTSSPDTEGDGAVYKLDPQGNLTVLHIFTGGTDGAVPQSGLTRDAAGNLYGTTASGGAAANGVVFKIDPDGNETVLYSFTESNSSASGTSPYSALTLDAAGNLYGTSTEGGIAGCYFGSCGQVYEVDSSGQYTVLYSFTGGADGGTPLAPVLLGPAGNLFGTASVGGTQNGGVLFELKGVTATPREK